MVTSDFGEFLGGTLSRLNNNSNTFVESEEIASLNIVALESVGLSSSYFVYKQNIGNHFTLDHPVNGYVDSATFQLDTGLGSKDLYSSSELP